MPSLNFKKQFADSVAIGTKCQTIRAIRKVPIKAGDRLFLFTGMRTKACYSLGIVKCTRVRQIRIEAGKFLVGMKRLNWDEANALARADGFVDELEFTRFFRDNHGLPFKGQLIEWAS